MKNKFMSVVVAAAVAFSMSIQPAAALTASQRVQYLKYYQCLAQQVFFPYIVCHL